MYNFMRFIISGLILMLMTNHAAYVHATENGRPVVGAIRWEGWYENSKWAKNLKPNQWHYKLPFYARVSKDKFEVRSDSQEIMDQEIIYASEAGLDYWAFCYKYPKSKDVEIPSGLLKEKDNVLEITEYQKSNAGLPLYLSSKHKKKLNFCSILLGNKKEQWPEITEHLVSLFKEPTYQKVLDGRPLLYRYYVEKMAEQFGSEENAKKALDYLRSETVKAGLKPPYFVAQVWNVNDGAEFLDIMGFDALSAYSMCIDAETNEQKEYPYSRLSKINRDFWNACKGTGKQVIPIVNAGWDVRPRWWDTDLMELYQGGHKPWFTEPSPAELANHLKDAIQWNLDNPSAGRANTVLIYAWNETDEGGWLHPTLAEGTARLDAIKKVLKKENCIK
jgi:hypothetical protein